MEERLLLRVPNETDVEAPRKRFEVAEKETRLNSVSALPFFLVGLATVLKQLFAEDEAAPAAEPGSSRPEAMGGEAMPDLSSEASLETAELDAVLGVAAFLRSLSDRAASGSHLPRADLGFSRPTGAAVPAPASDPVMSGASAAGRAGRIGPAESFTPARPTTANDNDPAELPPREEPAEDDDAEDDDEDGKGPATSANRRPVVTGPVVLGDGLVNQSVIISLSQLLLGASDADADPLAVESVAVSSGTLAWLGSDRFLYTPSRDEAGDVVFTYRVSDGTTFVAQTAHLRILPAHGDEILGTAGDDVLVGTPYDDAIDALAGDDIVYGREGPDVIHGGEGDDRLIGGDGDDVVYGGRGHDRLFGGQGDDTLFGEEGDDILFGEEGNDRLFGGAGDDELDGGQGEDVLSGEAGDDELHGQDGDDVLDGGAGNDSLQGGAGDDMLEGGEGDDSLQGGEGTDLLLGGDGDDTLSGDAGDDTLHGEAGEDVLCGGDGDDVIDGGPGDDTIDAGEGDDIIVVTNGEGNDLILGGGGTDTIDLSAIVFDSMIDLPDGWIEIADGGRHHIFDVENVRGGRGHDRLVANDDVNVMTGGSGNDTFVFRDLRALANEGGPRDHVMDFEVGDRIDLSRLGREIEDFAGKKLFYAGIAGATFSDVGAISFRHQTDPEQREFTIVAGQFDEDDEAEFELVLDGRHELTVESFILASRDAEHNNS